MVPVRSVNLPEIPKLENEVLTKQDKIRISEL